MRFASRIRSAVGSGSRRFPCAAAAAAAAVSLAVGQEQPPRNPDGTIQFRHALDNSPLALDLNPQETITPQVQQFHRTGENPYRGDRAAIEAGRALYEEWCAACHMPDGTGRIGPNLVDDQYLRPRVPTDVGLFEVIYGGGAGAMQAFGLRMDQDEILKVMAFLHDLRARAGTR